MPLLTLALQTSILSRGLDHCMLSAVQHIWLRDFDGSLSYV